MRRAGHVVAWAAAAALLAGVFAWYVQPEMMVAVGDLVWACFN